MAGFKIASAYVSVSPDDTGFEDELRAAIAAASDGVSAEVGVRVGDGAETTLAEDVQVAIDLATDGVKAHVGLGLNDGAVEALDADVKAGVELVEQDAKVKVSVDPKSAQDTQNGLSSLIVGGLAAGAALAPGLILAAASIATVGLGALVVKSNADIQATYHHLASDVGDALKEATAPLVPAVEASMVEVDQAVETLKPTLDSLFRDVEPDLYVFTQGIDSAATQFLPRFTQALNSSRGILSDFSAGLPALGAGLGNFFTGLTTNAQSTGRGFESFEQLTGTALGTAGQVIGSFSAAASSALSAVVPAADGALNVITKLANPETIGAAGGALAIKQWGSAIQSGLQSTSNAVTNFAGKAANASGIVGKVAPAAEEAASGLGSMADMMGGPWGMAAGAAIGLGAGLISTLTQSAASASDFTAAISQDSGQVGANTEAIIAQTLAKQDVNDLNTQLGVSTSTLIAYAAGDKTAQEQVNAAYNAKTAALQKASTAQGAHSKGEVEAGNGADQETFALGTLKQRLDEVTTAVASAISQQNEQTASLQAAEKATDVFTQQVNAQKLAQQQAAQTALVNATALNESLAPQGRLSAAAISASLAYQQASAATTAYTNALTALYSQYGDTSAAEASFTTALTGLKGQITSGTQAVNLHTAAGAKNYTAFQQAATAAETYSEKLYQQTGDANQANGALQQAVRQIDAMATQSGLSAKQVATLNTELFGVKNASDIKLSVDDSQVNAALAAVQNLEAATLAVSGDAGSSASGLLHTKHAGGGASIGGVPEIVGDGGRAEAFVPDTDGYVYSSVQAGQRAIGAHNAQVAAAAPAAPYGAQAPAQVHFNYYGPQYPNTELQAQMGHQLAGVLGGL